MQLGMVVPDATKLSFSECLSPAKFVQALANFVVAIGNTEALGDHTDCGGLTNFLNGIVAPELMIIGLLSHRPIISSRPIERRAVSKRWMARYDWLLQRPSYYISLGAANFELVRS